MIVVHDPGRAAVPAAPVSASAAPTAAATAETAAERAATPTTVLSAAPAAAGLAPEWQRLRYGLGGLLAVVCLGAFGWFGWQGRAPAALTMAPIAGLSRVEIKLH